MSEGFAALREIPRLELFLLLGIPAYWFAALFIWGGYYAIRGGMPRSARFDKIGGRRVVPRFLLEYGYWQLNWQVRVLMRLGFTANAVTVISLLLAIGGAYYLGLGHFLLGGWMMFMSFFCDAYDGLIARAQGTASIRGEYFDSFIDRYADLITSFGFLWYYKDDLFAALMVALGMVGSTAMGYAKAKGEAVGVDPNVGVMQRHERGVWMGVTTVMAPIFAAFIEPHAAHPRYHVALFALAVVALLTNVSAIWRAAYVMKRLPQAPAGHSASSAAAPPNPSVHP